MSFLVPSSSRRRPLRLISTNRTGGQVFFVQSHSVLSPTDDEGRPSCDRRRRVVVVVVVVRRRRRRRPSSSVVVVVVEIRTR